MDLAWLMISIVSPRTSTAFIDRFLVSAEAYRIPVIILFNKTDLYGEDEIRELEELERIYSMVGYRTLRLSLQIQRGPGRGSSTR